MKAALKYPVFYLAPAEHMVYVFWREENVTTRRQLAEANGWKQDMLELDSWLFFGVVIPHGGD